MKKIVIIGLGFAGLACISRLRRKVKNLQITIIDKKDSFDFLPMLPDSIGRDINPDYLSFSTYQLAKRYDFDFIKDEVRAINLKENTILTLNKDYKYDYCLIASGTETNFYENNEIKKYAYKLDSVSDVKIIRKALREKDYDSYVISGAGYTGVEVATNLRVFLQKINKDKRIIIVERAASVLGPLPEWMKLYVINNLKCLNIDILTKTTVEKLGADSISLSTGDCITGAMLIWTAGVTTADYVKNIEVEKSPQGRLRVDENLRISNNCFAAGDSALFYQENNPLRMAVQFAINEGANAANNILASMAGRKLDKFLPKDLGYIIPMANNNSCGKVFGLNLKGALPTWLHYLMCVYRSYGLNNQIGIIKNLIKPNRS